MATFGGPRFPGIENGLVFAIDPLNQESWTGPDSAVVNNIPPLSSTISGSIYNDTSGSLGISGSFIFDGTDDIINCTNTTYLNGVSQMSLSIWFNLGVAAQNKGLIGDYYTVSNIGHFSVVTKQISGDNYSLRFNLNGGDNRFNLTGNPFTINQWHNLTMVFDAGTLNFYIDGASAAYSIYEGSIPSSLSNNSQILQIGRHAAGELYWNGNIGPVLIYNRALTALEASQNYNQLKPRFT